MKVLFQLNAQNWIKSRVAKTGKTNQKTPRHWPKKAYLNFPPCPPAVRGDKCQKHP